MKSPIKKCPDTKLELAMNYLAILKKLIPEKLKFIEPERILVPSELCMMNCRIFWKQNQLILILDQLFILSQLVVFFFLFSSFSREELESLLW